MAWDDDKSTAADPDNPTADEQLSADEWDAHVADQKGHASRHEKGGTDELVSFGDTVHDSIDADVLEINAQNLQLYASAGDYLTNIDPSTTSTPVQDAIDTVKTAGGGWIVYPPTTIQDTGPIVQEHNVHHFAMGTEIEIQGSGNDGWVVDESLAQTTGITTSHVVGELQISHANGPTGTTGRGIVLNSVLQGSFWQTVVARQWADYGFLDSSASYENQFNHIALSEVGASSTYAASFGNSGGAAYNIDTFSIYPYDNGAYTRGIRGGNGGVNIELANMGGAIGRAWVPNTNDHGEKIGHINWEPEVDYGSVTVLVDIRVDRPVYLGSLTVNPQLTVNVDSVYYLDGVADVRLPIPNVNGGSITTIVDVASNTTTGQGTSTSSLIYHGQSGDVVNNSGGTLTQPVACLGDLTTVT